MAGESPIPRGQREAAVAIAAASVNPSGHSRGKVVIEISADAHASRPEP